MFGKKDRVLIKLGLGIIFLFFLFFIKSDFDLGQMALHSSGTFPPSTSQDYLRIAKEYLKDDLFSSAIDPLSKALKTDWENAQTHYLLALAYFKTENHHQAQRECEIALHIDSHYLEALTLLNEIKLEKGKVNWEKGEKIEACLDFFWVLENHPSPEQFSAIAELTGGKFKIRRLTSDLFADDAPSFSHNGKRVIFHTDTSFYKEDYGIHKFILTKSRLYSVNIENGHRKCLTSGDFSEKFARFSGDDKRIVFERENPQAEPKDSRFSFDRDIFIKDLDTKQEKRLTHNQKYDGQASFSPDNKRILFISDAYGGSSICILDLDTGEVKNLYEQKRRRLKIQKEKPRPYFPSSPSFSPDGREILFQAGLWKKKLFIMDGEGENIKLLALNQAEDFHPTFSPDGEKIAFVSNLSGDDELYLRVRDGSNLIKLTNDKMVKRYPSFSPDGRLLAFAAKQKGKDDCYFEIYILDLSQPISKQMLSDRLTGLLKIWDAS